MYIGAHVSTAGGLEQAPRNAHQIGANTFGLFVKNQRQWQAPPLTPARIDCFRQTCAALGYDTARLLPHGSYLINLGHPAAAARQKSLTAFVDELHRCRQLGLRMLNFHPGAHLRQCSEATCLAHIATALNRALDQTTGVTLVIENTAGQGSNVGYGFEQLAEIIYQVEDQRRVGVCLDTCHAFAAGYDLRTPAAYADTLRQFDATVGLTYLRAVHLNDSKRPLGSRVDRHEKLGEGQLGWAPFGWLVNDARLQEVLFILETPNQSGWAAEIEALRGCKEDFSDGAPAKA